MSSISERFGFYDAFCGIGAFHLAAADEGGVCVGACDIDRFARKTYRENLKLEPSDDIYKLSHLPPDTHVLFAGFPCPTFSIAGKSKLLSLGREHGFNDETRGQLIFHVMELADASKPPVIILENVKHLLNHDHRRTIKVILEGFAKIGYHGACEPTLLNARDFGVPQHRERVFIALFREDVRPPTLTLPQRAPGRGATLVDILEPEHKVPKKYTLGAGTWETLTRHKRYHAGRGNGFGYRILDLDDSRAVSPTISARYHKDGAEALVPQNGETRPRRLMPVEVKRLMGFPDWFQFPVSDTQAYRQLGNSIVVPVARAVVRAVIRVLEDQAGGLPFQLSSSKGKQRRLASQ